MPAVGNVCLAGFLLRSRFSSPGSVRLRAVSGIQQVWEQNPVNPAKAQTWCVFSLKRSNPSTKEKSEISHAPFLSSEHSKGRRKPSFFGLLLRREPLCFFLMYFSLIPQSAVWIILPTLQGASPSSSPLMDRSQIIANKLGATKISYRKLLKLPKRAIYGGDWGKIVLIAITYVQ